MRNILHDYPDEKCGTLLQNTIAAMDANSVLLIDEIIIPDKGAHPRSTELDMVMMTTLASIERTQKQWDKLLRSNGLERLRSATYNQATGESLQILKPLK